MGKETKASEAKQSHDGGPGGSGDDAGVGVEDRDGGDARVHEPEAEGDANEEKADQAKEAKGVLTVQQFLRLALRDPSSGIFVGQQIREVARQNDKRPAYVSFFTPDECVKNINGYDGLRDIYLFVHIPREFYEKHGAKAKQS